MTRRAALTIVALTLVASPGTVRTAERRWTPDALMRVKRIATVVPSPDASRVAFVVSEAVMEGEKSEWLSQIHVAASDGSGSTQLTRGDKSATSPQWAPDGQSIAFLSARGGDKANVFIISVSGGEAEQITNEKGSITLLRWAPDGKSIAFVMPEPKSDEEEKAAKEKRDMRVIDENEKLAGLYVVPLAKDDDGKRKVTKLATGAVHVTAIDWSPDSTAIAYAHQKTPKVFEQNDISIVRVAGGHAAAAGRDAGERAVAALLARRASRRLRAGRRSADLGRHGLGSRRARGRRHAQSARQDLRRAARLDRMVARRPGLYVAETQGTIGRLSLLPVDGGAPALQGRDDVNVTTPSVNRTGTAVGFAHAWSDKAPEPYFTRLERFAPKQVARTR